MRIRLDLERHRDVEHVGTVFLNPTLEWEFEELLMGVQRTPSVW